MNIDIRLSTGFFDHPKTKKLAKRCGIEGIICLQKLWLWAAEKRPTGILNGLDAEDIELAADWDGEERSFFDQLVSIGWIEESDGVYTLHGWEENQAYASKSDERAAKARKAAEARWGKREESSENAKGCHEDAGSNAQPCSTDATSINEDATSNAPETRNQKPVLKTEERVSEAGKPHRTPAPKKSLPTELTDFATSFQQRVAQEHGNLAPKMTEKLIADGADALDKCVRIDGLSLDEVKAAAMWAVTDSFWGQNLRSLGQMRTVGGNGVSKIKTVIADYRKTKTSTSRHGASNPLFRGAI